MSVDFREGIEAQPENLQAGADLLAQALANADLQPLREGTIVFSGIGASWHALLPAVRALRRAGRRAFAVPAVELSLAQGLGDAYVLVSQSGASSELVAALEQLDGSPVYVVSAAEQSPLARAAGTWLPLGPHPDTAVSTLSYTATLQALGILCEKILDSASASGWEELPGLARITIDRHDASARRLAERLAGVRTIDAVAASAALASAGETALLAREALRLPASGEETRQYLHGPLEAVDEGFACILFGAERELELARALASFGATVCMIGDLADLGSPEQDAPPGSPPLHSFALPALAEVLAPVLQIIPVQLTVAHAAAARGLTVDALRRQQDDTKVALGR
jgi:glutamine---fructose-6-phosphate transaminase (isomerizing)